MSTGQATDWASDADGAVLAIALRGNVLYAGGQFQRIEVIRHDVGSPACKAA